MTKEEIKIILDEACNLVYEKTNQVPLIIFLDGLTFLENLTNPSIRVYVVSDTTKYIDEELNVLNTNIKIKSFTFEDFKTNKKYMTSYYISNILGNFAILDNSKTFMDKVVALFYVFSLCQFLTSVYDKIYDMSQKLKLKTDFDVQSKFLSIKIFRLVDLFTNIMETKDVGIALDKTVQNLNNNFIVKTISDGHIILGESNKKDVMTFDNLKEIIDKLVDGMSKCLMQMTKIA